MLALTTTARAWGWWNYPPDNEEVTLTSTNLPIVWLDVDGQYIDRYERITAQMKNNMHYKRFRHFGKDKVTMDFAFFAIAFNIKGGGWHQEEGQHPGYGQGQRLGAAGPLCRQEHDA